MPRHPDFDPELLATLRHAGPEADEQRRALLHGRRVLFVMGGYPGKRAMYQRARELGIRMVVLDGPGHWTQAEPELFEHFVEVDLADPKTLLPRALAALQATGLTFDAVATFWELGSLLTAHIAEHLGVLGHLVSVVSAARQKTMTREICSKAGIPTPRFTPICSHADIETSAAEVQFPAVLKPVSGVCSTSVYHLRSVSELRARYAQVLSDARFARHVAHAHSDDQMALIWGGGMEMLLEEFLDGEEFDVDCLLCAGELVYANLVRDLPMPHMVETGQQIPPRYPAGRQAELIDFAREVLAALGFRDGAFHVEVKYTSQGPRLIEVNARIGGGPAWDLHRRVWGVDLVEQYLMVQLGIPICPVPAPSPLAFYITSDLPAPVTGIVTRSDFLDHLAGHPHVLAAYPKVRPGQHVIGPDTGVPEWLGEIVVQGESAAHAEALMADILATVELPVRSEHRTEEAPAYYITPPARSIAIGLTTPEVNL
jgi:biotin carboxylase